MDKLLVSDYVVIFSVMLFLVAHWSTNYIITLRTDLAQDLKVSEQAVKLVEANPIAKYFIGVRGLNHIFTFIIMPSLVFAVYYFIRKRYRHDIPLLNAHSLFIFSVAFIDATNDLSILLAHLV